MSSKIKPRKGITGDWVDINQWLPQCAAIDLLVGGTFVIAKDATGNEIETQVCDHIFWGSIMRQGGITHWKYSAGFGPKFYKV